MSGKTLHVSLALWFLHGFGKPGPLKLTAATREKFGVERHAAQRALRALEASGLILVRRRRGRSSEITLLAAEMQEVA